MSMPTLSVNGLAVESSNRSPQSGVRSHNRNIGSRSLSPLSELNKHLKYESLFFFAEKNLDTFQNFFLFFLIYLHLFN